MSRISRKLSAAMAIVLGATTASATDMDSRNPTCPESPNWSSNRTMEFTPVDRNGQRVLLAEGFIDSAMPGRLQRALDGDPQISEIWFRSPGGDALAGNDAGMLIRSQFPGMITRIPSGWACFSACNFVFMGGQLRVVESGGLFIVHMFTHTGNRTAIRQEIEGGTDSAVDFIRDIEQASAQLASEDNDFLIRMGISRRLLTEVMYATSAAGETETRRCLTADEVMRYNVANIQG